MYCMPKVGSKVSLYFSSEEETSARVVNCIRENGKANVGMFEPSNRGLSTEHGKKLFLNPKELGISEEEKGNYLKLEDEVGVRLESSKKIEITAKGKTKLIGKQVLLETPVEINLVSMNQISSSKSTKKAKANTTSFGSLSSSSPLQSSNATQVGFHPLSNSTQDSGINIDKDKLPETLLFMNWTSDPRHPEKEYYVTTVSKEYAVTRSVISYIPFMDKASDALLEWLTNAEIVTAEEVDNAIKNFIGNVNNVYSIIDTAGGIKKLKDWEKIPKAAKKGLKWASKVSSIITYVFVGVDTVTELINDYTTGYIVDFIFGHEMLADDKETALVKYIYAYQETKKLIQEGKIEYEES